MCSCWDCLCVARKVSSVLPHLGELYEVNGRLDDLRLLIKSRVFIVISLCSQFAVQLGKLSAMKML